MKFNRLGRTIEDTLVAKGRLGFIIVATFAKMGMDVLALLHILACSLYYIGRITKENASVFGNNWLDKYVDLDSSLVSQYLLAFHWMLSLFSTVPFPHIPQNEAEQIFLVLAIVIGLPVIGSFLSRLIGFVTQMNAKATENTRKMRHLEQYLMTNHFPVDL